MRILRV